MAKKNKKSRKPKVNDLVKQKQADSPIGKKIVLLVFGIGPILFVSWFLYSKGFFNTI